MEKGYRALEIAIAALMLAAFALYGFAITIDHNQHGTAFNLSLGGTACLVSGVGLFVVVFLLHPFFLFMIKTSKRWIATVNAIEIPVPSPLTPGVPIASSSILIVVHAQYGRADITWEDVTERVRAYIRDDRIDFPVTNEALGGDPCVDWAKFLEITYLENGIQKQSSFNEDDRAVLP